MRSPSTPSVFFIDSEDSVFFEAAQWTIVAPFLLVDSAASRFTHGIYAINPEPRPLHIQVFFLAKSFAENGCLP